MVNKSKQRGTAAEAAVVKALIEEGWIHAERRALAGALDKGDIAGLPGVCIEVKNEKAYSISQWIKETLIEKVNSNAEIGFCWFKIKGKGDPRDWGVLLTGEQAMAWLKLSGHHPEARR